MIRDKLKVALKDMFESLGPRGSYETLKDMIESKEVTPEDFDLKELWEACVEYETSIKKESPFFWTEATEAVSSDMFPIISGEIINAKIIEGYNNVAAVGDSLVTVNPSKMEIENYSGFTASEGPLEVLQGAEYEDSNIAEKYVQIPHVKMGRLISITEEAIYFEKTGQLLMRAQRIGEAAAQEREKTIVQGVQDIDSNVFRPSGTPTAIFRTSVSGTRQINSRASTPFGEDGINQAMKLFHNLKDEKGNFINVNPSRLTGLFPWDLYVQAHQMVNSSLVPEGNENAVNPWKGYFKPVYSPYVTEQSASTWYIGDFARQFVWSEVWPLQTMRMRPGNEVEFRRDIKATFKVRYYGGIGALDDVYVLKLTT